ncbi:MAG: hypothetical protein ACK446_03905 [Rhodobacterales bacterium]
MNPPRPVTDHEHSKAGAMPKRYVTGLAAGMYGHSSLPGPARY